MTALEIISHATMLPFDASMPQVSQARKDLRAIEDVITGEENQNNWRDAMDHLDCIDEEHRTRMVKHIPVRIM